MGFMQNNIQTNWARDEGFETNKQQNVISLEIAYCCNFHNEMVFFYQTELHTKKKKV